MRESQSSIVPGKFFVFVEEVVTTNYHTLVIDATTPEEAEAIVKAKVDYDEGYITTECVLKPMSIKSEATFTVKPMRNHHLTL